MSAIPKSPYQATNGEEIGPVKKELRPIKGCGDTNASHYRTPTEWDEDPRILPVKNSPKQSIPAVRGYGQHDLDWRYRSRRSHWNAFDNRHRCPGFWKICRLELNRRNRAVVHASNLPTWQRMSPKFFVIQGLATTARLPSKLGHHQKSS